MLLRNLVWALAAVPLVLAAGCGEAPESHLPDGGLTELSLDSVEPDTVLPGTWVRVHGQGFTGSAVRGVTVVLHGAGDPSLTPEIVEEELVKFQVNPGLFSSLGGPGTFQGSLEVQVEYSNGMTASEQLDVRWTLERSLTPGLQSFSANNSIIYLGSEFQIPGSGFLMEGEGVTRLRFAGTWVPDVGGGSEAIGRTCDFEATRRDLLQLPFSADCLGIAPGEFSGSIEVVNVHQGGDEVAGTGLTEIQVQLGPTLLTRVEPMEARRGQKVDIAGRGFVAGSAITTIRVEGTFTDRDGKVTDLSGSDVLEIVPDVLSGETMQYVLRVEPDGRGGVKGLGAEAGVLRGTATPIIYYETDTGMQIQEGVPLGGELVFQVLRQRQVVFLKYLPGFTDALRDFGMRNMEHLIKDRILEVCIRDYEGFNVEFRTIRPTDFVEYAVLEIGGKDPNGRDLIGLDNTMGKDIGNIHFDDVAGGWNADSAENGNAAFGGVFVSSYMGFSLKAEEPMPLASAEFDRLFGPFMPSQGGQPVESDEYPGGARADSIGEAIHAMGSMIGTTVVHEIGHTLGLAAGPPDMFHNIVPADNQIMDAGIYREFEERAEVNGKGPGVWTAENRAYLEAILPED